MCKSKDAKLRVKDHKIAANAEYVVLGHFDSFEVDGNSRDEFLDI